MLAAGCGDGGWGSDPPDTTLGHRPDAGGHADLVASDAGTEASADTSADLAPDPGVADPGPSDPGGAPDGDVTSTCGQGPGNELGIGQPCTKSGHECPSALDCDVDLDPQGVGVCIKLMCKAEADCGTNAGCCQTTDAPPNFKVCIHDDCLPPECASLRGN